MPDIIEQYEWRLAILKREHTQDQWDRLQAYIEEKLKHDNVTLRETIAKQKAEIEHTRRYPMDQRPSY